MGLLACMVCEGGSKIGHVLGDDGIDLLMEFFNCAFFSEAHRLGYMALFDAVLGHRGPSLHIVRSKHAVDLLMQGIEELISLEVVTEAFEIVCALSRVEGVPESHFHSLEAVDHIVNVVTVFDNKYQCPSVALLKINGNLLCCALWAHCRILPQATIAYASRNMLRK